MRYRIKRVLSWSAALSLFLLFFSCRLPWAGRESEENSFSVLSYNVQTLFDDRSDGREFDGYDPAVDSWDTKKYNLRLARLADVIEAAAAGGPDIVALQEIESEKVIQDLTSRHLPGYPFFAASREEKSAIRVGVISRYPLLEVRCHAFARAGDEVLSRGILEVLVEWSGERLRIFNNHWKSKREGAEVSEPYRLYASGVLTARIRQLREAGDDGNYLILGDLNESADEFYRSGGRYQTAVIPEGAEVPASYAEKSLLLRPLPLFSGESASAGDSSSPEEIPQAVALYSPWLGGTQDGTYFFDGEWLTLDHFLLSSGLVTSPGLLFHSFRVVSEDFLLDENGLPGRWELFSGRGYSDHLPILLTLCRND